jgi:hypothetical protein
VARKPPKQLRRGKSWTEATIILSAQPSLWNNKKHTECGKPGPRKQNHLNAKHRKELETGCEKNIWPKAQKLCSRHAQEWEDVVLTRTERKWRALFFEQQTDNGHKQMRSGRAHERGGREREEDHICPNERAQTCKFSDRT